MRGSLRFGFASGVKEPTREGQDGVRISHRSIAQAGELAAGALDGEVLVSPQLAALLVESGLSFRAKDVHLPDGRVIPACLLDLTVGVAAKPEPLARPPVEGKVADALIRIYQTLMSQASEMTRKQADLEARLDVALSRTLPAEAAGAGATRPGRLDGESDLPLRRMNEQQQTLDQLEERINALHQSAADAERKLAEVLEVQSRADAATHMLTDINLNLEMLSEQRAAVDHVSEQLARLDFTLQEAQNTLRALQREREVAERIEQGMKALRNRSGAGKLG
jgi:hypothetical protein